MDYQELKVTLDHTDDIDHERIFDIFLADLRERGETCRLPADPLTDQTFIRLLTQVYDPGLPAIFPPEPEENLIAAE
jgi:hypothetical protein